MLFPLHAVSAKQKEIYFGSGLSVTFGHGSRGLTQYRDAHDSATIIRGHEGPI